MTDDSFKNFLPNIYCTSLDKDCTTSNHTTADLSTSTEVHYIKKVRGTGRNMTPIVL